MPISQEALRERMTETAPECLDEVAARLYEASDAADLWARALLAPQTLAQRVELIIRCFDQLARERELLGDYVYNLTKPGAELRLALAEVSYEEPERLEREADLDAPPF